MQQTPFAENAGGILDALHRIPFLREIDDRHLHSIFRMSKMVSYEKGEKIIVEGTCESHLYILLSGEVKISKYDAAVAWLRQSGDIFGEFAMIDLLPRSANAIALAPTTCLTIDAPHIDALPAVDQAIIHSILYKSLAQLLTERLRATSEELASLKRGILASAPSV